MAPRVHRFILEVALILFAAVPVYCADTPVRTTPQRPGARLTAPPRAADLAATLSVAEVAKKLGLKAGWIQPGVKVALTDGTRRLQLEADSREAIVDGIRVFLGAPVLAKRDDLFVNVIDYEAALVPLLKPALIPQKPARPKVIAIDAGHGGLDQGTENRELGYKEKTFALDVALRLKAALEKMGFTTVMTRATDLTIDKAMRVLIANRASADVFISIHFNHLPNDQKTRGTEVFTFAPQYQRSTNSWSPLEPDDTEREASPGNLFDPWNSLLANALHRQLLRDLKTFDRGKKIAHLGVLRGLKCPGVLVESGFLSNEEEARKIATPAYRQQIAGALAAGIQAYARQIEALRAKP
jgi:N-acetylmuramoyl-L-alanine amidase